MSELNTNQLHRLRSAANEIDRVLAEVSPKPNGQGAIGRAAAPEPRAETKMRRKWDFLNALDAAGGRVTAPELSRLGRERGYKSGRALNAYYRGEDPTLRKDGDKRELTAAGKRFVRSYDRLFGSVSR